MKYKVIARSEEEALNKAIELFGVKIWNELINKNKVGVKVDYFDEQVIWLDNVVTNEPEIDLHRVYKGTVIVTKTDVEPVIQELVTKYSIIDKLVKGC